MDNLSRRRRGFIGGYRLSLDASSSLRNVDEVVHREGVADVIGGGKEG